ncbi:MAG TPA: cytochrome c oxidase assembly protein [Steroidobacteraceae bacterium]|nr:cytochrome c oxidase assembly protein [Steroidobacteraceae bacterium]
MPALSFSSLLSLLLPWELSPTVLISVALVAILYVRGAPRTDPPTSPGRRCVFSLGLLLVYAALQTRWDYYASHMFFVHRIQHLVLHDVGPALLVATGPGAALACGLPAAVRRRLGAIKSMLRVPAHLLLDPFTATIMYIASLLLWLWPSVHFDVMLSGWLYKTMNWSVVLCDLPFWWLVLDPRPWPLARLKPRWRVLMLGIVMLPMMVVGAVLSLSTRDLYIVYQICGRFLPISPVTDQQLGGLVIWIPGAFVIGIVFLVVLARMLGHERQAERTAAALRVAKPVLTK